MRKSINRRTALKAGAAAIGATLLVSELQARTQASGLALE